MTTSHSSPFLLRHDTICCIYIYTVCVPCQKSTSQIVDICSCVYLYSIPSPILYFHSRNSCKLMRSWHNYKNVVLLCFIKFNKQAYCLGGESVRLLLHFFTAFMHTACSGSCCGDHSCECHMSLHGYHEVMLQTTGYNGTSMLHLDLSWTIMGKKWWMI